MSYYYKLDRREQVGEGQAGAPRLPGPDHQQAHQVHRVEKKYCVFLIHSTTAPKELLYRVSQKRRPILKNEKHA